MTTLAATLAMPLGGDLVATPEVYSRMLTSLLPPGKLWNLVSGVLVDLLLGSSDELARVDANARSLLTEVEPATTLQLLPEHEAEFGLTPSPSQTTAERQANVVARQILRARFRPVDFQTALAPLLGQDAADVVVIERDLAFVALVGDQREIFDFFIYRNPLLPGTYYLASAQQLVDDIEPSHTRGTVIESVSFLCDDPFSLCDRDLLGA